MKRVAILSIIFLFMISPSVHAGLWAFDFVVWDGKMYEVKKEELVEESEIGKRIGKVKTQRTEELKIKGIPRTSGMTYYGNFSNAYPIGTPYREIKGISSSTSIAIKVDNQWVKAVYVDNAPYHVMNTVTNLSIIVPIAIIPLILIGFIKRTKRLKNHLNAMQIYQEKKIKDYVKAQS